MDTSLNNLYRQLPQVGELVDSVEAAWPAEPPARPLVTETARGVLAHLRQQVKAGELTETSLALRVTGLAEEVQRALEARLRPSLRRVINATGVILQTNLGRAPLSEAALEHLTEVARGYCNLELDLGTGERSRRDAHAEPLLLELLASRTGEPLEDVAGRQGAAVVNNCAAATFLALNTMAEGGEVIVSRGELVEIGGGFRIPDILRKSGATLREVGTTNRTRVGDYAEAITAGTRLILRVHRSNFRIEGFTEQPSIAELVALGKRSSVPVFDDQGTGCVVDLAEVGLHGESSWVESTASGVALVAASGDKLLGGPQCGLLVGDREVIERLRKNPLFRALRVDKLTYAALGTTLLTYLRGREGELPAIAMLRLPAEGIRVRCERWAAALGTEVLRTEVVPVRSVAGGGTTPGATLPSFAVALEHARWTESLLAERLRGLRPAVMTRTHAGRVLLDLRTVFAADDDEVIRLLQTALRPEEAGDTP